MEKNNIVLDIQNLKLHFRTTRGTVQAVDGVDFKLRTNQAVVVVGESGCGKTSLSKAVLRLLPRNVEHYSGKVYLNDIETMSLDDEEYRKQIRWVKMSLVPQAAMNALNPVLKVGDQVAEPMVTHYGISKADAMTQVHRMLDHVGVPVAFAKRYAFELSGGMRQRVAIAMSLVTSPDLLVLDEPTSALDVLTQANIFNTLKRIKEDLQVSFILITHDISTSSELADRAVVMYAGEIVEVNDSATFFTTPLHPYSQKLLASVPRLRAVQDPEFIPGQPPSLVDLPPACRFAPRCTFRFDKCDQDPPIIRKGRIQVRCWLHA